MFVRIVKMSFHQEHIETFKAIFEEKKKFIKNSEGCKLLELYQDKNNKELFFTYSYWETEQDLENYRNSELFKNVWTKTKALFNNKAEAWSVDKKVTLL
ncbi:MAG: antibiotic biosynthesis monooxygenase family protein [Polaribacter sp.]